MSNNQRRDQIVGIDLSEDVSHAMHEKRWWSRAEDALEEGSTGYNIKICDVPKSGGKVGSIFIYLFH